MANADFAPCLVLCDKIGKTYGEHNVTALANVDLQIRRGEFVALMGPSGCGKSTLLNIIGAIDAPTTGDVSFDGKSLKGLSDDELTKLRRNKIGFVFQFFNLLSTLTVAENVSLPLELQHVKRTTIDEAVATALGAVGLGARAEFYPAQLSGGEMQRAAIARALIHRPALIVADEPTGNLDSENGQSVLSLIKSLNKQEGQTIVMATHSNEAAANADRTIFMRDGLIVSEQEYCSRL